MQHSATDDPFSLLPQMCTSLEDKESWKIRHFTNMYDSKQIDVFKWIDTSKHIKRRSGD